MIDDVVRDVEGILMPKAKQIKAVFLHYAAVAEVCLHVRCSLMLSAKQKPVLARQCVVPTYESSDGDGIARVWCVQGAADAISEDELMDLAHDSQLLTAQTNLDKQTLTRLFDEAWLSAI